MTSPIISLVSLSLVALARGDLVLLDNGVITVGVDPTRGGSLSYLSQSGKNYSVINRHDLGREIQVRCASRNLSLGFWTLKSACDRSLGVQCS